MKDTCTTKRHGVPVAMKPRKKDTKVIFFSLRREGHGTLPLRGPHNKIRSIAPVLLLLNSQDAELAFPNLNFVDYEASLSKADG